MYNKINTKQILNSNYNRILFNLYSKEINKNKIYFRIIIILCILLIFCCLINLYIFTVNTNIENKITNPVKTENIKNTSQTLEITNPVKTNTQTYNLISEVNTETNDFKSYMDYKTITDKSSNQYKLLSSGKIKIAENGLLIYAEEYYCLALSSKYGTIGSLFEISLNNDYTFKAIKADAKQDTHVINNLDGNFEALEFIVSTQDLNTQIKTLGNISHIPQFNGSPISIKQIGQVEV